MNSWISRAAGYFTIFCASCVFLPYSLLGQQITPPPAANTTAEEIEAPLAGDWAPEILYEIWNSPNVEAASALYRAAFAAGPAIIPQLEAALTDDRTAEFAAQSLAFIGGKRSLQVLSKLRDDPRDLGLRRFFYGALGEADTPEGEGVLLEVIRNSDSEPDRTVTEAAILALTVRSDTSLVSKLEELQSKVHDPVVRDDLENAADVIQARAKFLATPQGMKPDFSIERAVRTYFIPALETPSNAPATAKPAGAQQGAAARPPSAPPKLAVSVRIENLTFSPDKTRALARVLFEIPTAVAQYDMVLQKRAGDWTLASVWLGPEFEKTGSEGRNK